MWFWKNWTAAQKKNDIRTFPHIIYQKNKN